MPKNKIKPEIQEFDLEPEKLGNVVNKKNYKSGEIESVEKSTGEENLKDEDKIFNNIHTKPADEQQFENNSLDSDNTK